MKHSPATADTATAGHELAYNASAIQTLRGLSPLPGQALLAGMRVAF